MATKASVLPDTPNVHLGKVVTPNNSNTYCAQIATAHSDPILRWLGGSSMHLFLGHSCRMLNIGRIGIGLNAKIVWCFVPLVDLVVGLHGGFPRHVAKVNVGCLVVGDGPSSWWVLLPPKKRISSGKA